ncbi:MAG: TIM44-like domain-containing protein [Myxococcaceae bacterium]
MLLLLSSAALARVGGGENYQGERNSRDGGGDGGGAEIIIYLIALAFDHPVIGVPLLVGVVALLLMRSRGSPTVQTRKAFEQREAELRTQVSPSDVTGWVNRLRLRDPEFDLAPLHEKVRKLFLDTQQAWFRRDLTSVRPFISDATFQRLTVQLKLMDRQGVRDAVTDAEVLDLQLIGLDQSDWFDSVHIRVRAQLRDADAPSSANDAQALEAARRAPIERFTEVWTFVRKPGAKTKVGRDLYQGKCPNCGAPYQGGASNACEFCKAIVNSGNYDWTLSEITQGSEHIRHYPIVDGLLEARQADPALNLEVLEDRASLVFWKWIEAQTLGVAGRMAKLSIAAFQTTLQEELSALAQQKRRKVFLECAVGAATVKLLRPRRGELDEAHVEIRWSAKMGIGGVDQALPELPTVPQRWVFTLVRKNGATTNVDNGVSTSRCPSCNAPLTDSLTPACEFCKTPLSSGERDWVLALARSYEAWSSQEDERYRMITRPAQRRVNVISDVQERERLLYMMAAVAVADGELNDAERKLLKLCSDRWSVPWSNVELALNAGSQLFDRLIPKATPEAAAFLQSIVHMALIDGKIDKAERRMLEAAAAHLGMEQQLAELLNNRDS